MTHIDELDSYRRLMAAATPKNPRRESDLQASLRAFDAAQGVVKQGWLPSWLRLPVVVSGMAAMAAGVIAVAYLPQQMTQPEAPPIAPPDLRLALPTEPAVTAPNDAEVLAAFSSDLPQYFPLPWDRGSVLALLAGAEGEPAEQPLFAAAGRRLVVLPRRSEMAGSRGHEDSYQRFAIALAGLALLGRGQDLGPEWSPQTLLAEAHKATQGLPAREAALAAVTAPEKGR